MKEFCFLNCFFQVFLLNHMDLIMPNQLPYIVLLHNLSPLNSHLVTGETVMQASRQRTKMDDLNTKIAGGEYKIVDNTSSKVELDTWEVWCDQ